MIEIEYPKQREYLYLFIPLLTSGGPCERATGNENNVNMKHAETYVKPYVWFIEQPLNAIRR